MQDDSPRPALGSGRRRPRNNAPMNPTQRNYASENDMSSAQPHFPQTPQKSASSSPAPASAAGHQASSKRGGRDKTRPKNLPLSPDSARRTRQASHPASIPKAGIANAFAGATFHASPAPSSLPIPSFLSKGAESPTVNNGHSLDRPALSQTVGWTPIPTPSRASSAQTADASISTPSRASPSPAARDSPLELMFKADREEREQARRASVERSSQHKNTRSASSISQLPTGPSSTQFYEPHSPSLARHGRPDEGKPAPELGNYFGKSIGPSFSAPYQERMRAARRSNVPNQLKGGSWESISPAPDASDRSEALKRYLFGNANAEELGTSRAPSKMPPVTAVPTMTTATHVNGGEKQDRDEEVIAMEKNLRRLLNLDHSMADRQPVRQSQ
ncbi:hypothetical protein VUR80DRAFT_5038 [Thermomyces stellatus]